jgi:uncharacterized cupin superfamily protein
MKMIVRKPTAAEIAEAKKWPVWEKEASSFEWSYSDQETCLIVEGRASVEGRGQKVTFGAGDYVVFPQGLECTWTIDRKIRKHYKFG